MYWCSFVTLYISVACIYSTYSQDTLDTLEPIVKISPAKATGSLYDRFGFSVTAHRLEDINNGDTLEDILRKTTIIVGAPLGLFPGGLSGLDYGSFACPGNSGATQSERETCFNDDFNSTGLIYQCGLDNGDCGALIGNGMADTPDGYLFERSGNDPAIITTSIENEDGDEIKNDQQMGFKVISSDGFFVACAPMWKHLGSNGGPQPRGRCVYSDRSLSNFTILLPCISGNRLNQNMGGYCSTGMGVSLKSSDDGSVQIGVGTPGRYFSRGGFAYYADAANRNLTNGVRVLDVPPSVGAGDVVGRRDHDNTPPPIKTVGYYGVAMDSGQILSPNSTEFLVGAPHMDLLTLIGRVYVVPLDGDYFNKPTQSVQGEQFSELFGYAVLVVDLNNDGYDDAVIGAPMYYERERPELGRVFIFENDKNGNFKNSTKIIGQAANSRFGLSLTSVGDLNDDGYNDIAVGAPYEGSGAVYIYYGQPADSEGRIVNPQYAQRIDGSSFVSKVSNLTEVSMFGFSVSGNVDVDNNQYNDLVIGAYGSQSVFVLRSRPYARIVANLSSVAEVKLMSYGCELNGLLYSCFDVQLCASYSGKGIAEQFSTMIMVQEVSRPRRLQFSSDATPATTTASITFNSTNTQSCVNVTAYIRNGTTSLDEFELSGRVLNIDRPDVEVDTNTVPSDLSTLPYIESQPLSLLVGVFAECGPDDVCDSDLKIALQNVTYRTRSGDLSSDQTRLVVDDVQEVYIQTLFSNAEEDAFNSFVTFSVPKQFFVFEQALVDDNRINCAEMNSNDTHDNRRCNVLSPLPSSRGKVDLTIRLTVASDVTGDEGSAILPIAIMIGENSTRNNEISNLLSDNTVYVEIPISARSLYTVSVAFNPDFESYQGNHTPVVDNIVNNLGESNMLTTTFRNEGPTTIRRATLTIYVPTRAEITEDFYFYYPFTVSASSSSVSCSTIGFNPKEYRQGSVGGTKRRRRRSGTRLRDGKLGLLRIGRQSGTALDVNCEANPSMCAQVSCNITNLGRSAVDVTVLGYLDERFYNGKSDQYFLLAHAEGVVTGDYYNTNGSSTSDNSTLTLAVESRPAESQGIPWYVIAVPIFAAIVFFVVLVIALYYFGILRRKSKTGQTGGDEEFDQFDDNPFGKGAGGPPPPPAGTSSGDPELMKYEEKKEKF